VPPVAAPAAASRPSAASGPLAVRRVSVKAGAVPLLTGVDFTLHPGELCALVGPSGAGKSTLLKVLLGLRTPAAGEVRLGGAPQGRGGPVGYVPQRDALHTTLRVERALAYAADLRLPGVPAGERRRRILHALADVGLMERRDVRIARLSGGQQKRVSVALELLASPGLLILDEPTSGLDPGLEAQLMALFGTVAAQGRVVLVATHAMESLDRCQALLVLVQGHVAYFGPPRDAPGYFGVDRYAAIFPALAQRRGAEWHEAYARHALARSFAARPAPALGPGP
jgi:ABC-type multidrug transport system ATPase subunit